MNQLLYDRFLFSFNRLTNEICLITSILQKSIQIKFILSLWLKISTFFKIFNKVFHKFPFLKITFSNNKKKEK